MRGALTQSRRQAPTTAELVDVLQGGLRRSTGARVAVTHIGRSDSIYATSHVIENLDVGLSDGSTLRLVFKDVGEIGLMDGARQAKPAFMHDPLRELQTYRTILADAELGTATCHATVADERSARYWLFLERVPGVELYQVGALDTWRQVAGWLARTHLHLSGAAEQLTATHGRLLHHDARFYRTWSDRAVRFAHMAGISNDDRRELGRVARRYHHVVERLVAAPVTVIHGEFYASNVLVTHGDDGCRVCPVDWETTAVGPGVVDLAALTAGPWSAHDRAELISAYRDALIASGLRAADVGDLEGLLDCASLHLAMQWLGWSPDWTPPADHARDWLAEALGLADRLSL